MSESQALMWSNWGFSKLNRNFAFKYTEMITPSENTKEFHYSYFFTGKAYVA